ncbi:MAG: hypothetical protein M3Z10_08220 [Gemmatimonadota bacterium]|nr:hypothetical protein [Gemmatimonadota bacterium]
MRDVSLLILLGLGGCASGATIERPPTPQTVRVSGSAAGNLSVGMNSTTDAKVTRVTAAPADVWRVLPGVYDSFAIPLSSVDDRTRVLGNTGFNLRRRLGSVPLVRLIDCGTTQGGPSADTYDIRLSVLTQVTPVEGGGSSIITTVDAMGRPVAFSGEYVRCTSTGSLETRIADAIQAQLRK